MATLIKNNISFVESSLVGRVPDITNGGLFTEMPIVQRIDPVFGSRARFIEGTKLSPDDKPEIESLVSPAGFCPFCPENVDNVTFPFPLEMVPSGKIRKGRSLVVPNVMAYSTYSAVGIYDTTRHYIGIEEFSSDIIFDVLSSMLEHTTLIRAYDPAAEFSSINANYLPPSGSSLVHPHIQSSHDYVPFAKQATFVEKASRHLADTGRNLLMDLVEAENDSPRLVGSIGAVTFLTPFAPSGFREVWAIVGDATDLIDVSEYSARALADGIAIILGGYSSWNLSSFNFSFMGGGSLAVENGINPLFRIVARANPAINYRSDVTYFEKMYDELMIDITPEQTAQDIRKMFG